MNDDGSGQPKAPTKSQEEFFIFMNFLVYSIFVCFTKARARNLNDIGNHRKVSMQQKMQDCVVATQIFFHPDPWGNDPI